MKVVVLFLLFTPVQTVIFTPSSSLYRRNQGTCDLYSFEMCTSQRNETVLCSAQASRWLNLRGPGVSHLTTPCTRGS